LKLTIIIYYGLLIMKPVNSACGGGGGKLDWKQNCLRSLIESKTWEKGAKQYTNDTSAECRASNSPLEGGLVAASGVHGGLGVEAEPPLRNGIAKVPCSTREK